MPTVKPGLTVMLVAALPTPASDYAGMMRRTTEGLFYSDGVSWGRVDAPGIFYPVTPADYALLDPEVQADETILFVQVADATSLRPTRTWAEVTSVPGVPDPDTLYVVNA